MPIAHIPRNLVQQMAEHGIDVRDVVLYITSACNLRCAHCYVGDSLLDAAVRYDGADLSALLTSFGSLDRITILGGEPLLHPDINAITQAALDANISERRITSNLTNFFHFDVQRFSRSWLTICGSLDGATASVHDKIRGVGSFDQTLSNLAHLVTLGYDLEITHTVTARTISDIWEMIALCREIGITKLNLHKISKHGNATANEDLLVQPEDWVALRRELHSKTSSSPRAGRHTLQLRIPVLFASPDEYRDMLAADKYWPMANGSYYCSGEGHRMVLYPDRRIYMSSEFFGTESFVGSIEGEKFMFNESIANEIRLAEQSKKLGSTKKGNLIELSYSFKDIRFVV